MTLTFSIDWTLRCGKGTNRKTQWFTTHETVPCKSKRQANWSPKMGWQKALKLFENLFCHKNTQITANHFLLLFPFEINKHKQSAFKSH